MLGQKEWVVDNEVIDTLSTRDQKFFTETFGVIQLTSCTYISFEVPKNIDFKLKT